MSTRRTVEGLILVCDYCGSESVPLAPLDERDTPQGIAGHAPAPLGWSWHDLSGGLIHSCSACSVLVDPADWSLWPSHRSESESESR